MRTLTKEEAKAFYDSFGAKQDKQTFYEASALQLLVENASLPDAHAVFEFGCGTGRFALEMMEDHLGPSTLYQGVDISTTMIGLATERLAPVGPRATVSLAEGHGRLPLDDGSVDRFVSTYVLDLLPETEARYVLQEARRVLRPEGLLCLAGVTHGVSLFSRIVMGTWAKVFAWKPSLVGGCRPTELSALLPPSLWKERFHKVVVAWGVASEVVIATPGAAGA